MLKWPERMLQWWRGSRDRWDWRQLFVVLDQPIKVGAWSSGVCFVIAAGWEIFTRNRVADAAASTLLFTLGVFVGLLTIMYGTETIEEAARARGRELPSESAPYFVPVLGGVLITVVALAGLVHGLVTLLQRL